MSYFGNFSVLLTNYLSKISFDIFLERVDYAQKNLYVFPEEKLIKILELCDNEKGAEKWKMTRN